MMRKIRSALKLFERQVRDFFRIVRLCHRAAPLYSPNYFKVFLRALRLCFQEQFSAKEAFRLGLFNPNLSPGQLSKYISKKNLLNIQLSINPISCDPLVRDKGIFYRYCMALGIPIPKLYAIFFRTTAGWSCKGAILTSRSNWEKFFDNQLPMEFVIKPARGSHGRKVNIFSRNEEGFIDAFGKTYRAADIYDTMLSAHQYDSFIIQERLKNHPELVRLNDVPFLQTVRIITFVDRNNHCQILHAYLKLITGQNVTDNFDDGLSGNMEVEASLDDGVLGPAIALAPNGLVIKNNHPKTGLSFDRFQLPLWEPTCKLIKKTAPMFLPLRTIGWDVALTPNGPCILEANSWWGAPNQHRRMDVILDALSHNQSRKQIPASLFKKR